MWNTDEGWNSDYDSTWEDEEPCPKKKKTQHWFKFGNRAARDMQNYRHGYGGSDRDTAHDSDYPEEMPNLLFYQNRIEFEPYGVIIEDIHQHWWYDYRELEENHSYIQWLFPLREPGVNRYATPLTPAEIRRMRADEDVMWRLLESYKLMLGFYGIHLLDEKTGKVSRARNWEERYRNLNRRSHNNLRITRILKCLGEMGYDHLQAPLVQFFLEETLCNNQLPNVKRSVLDYFMFTVKDKQQHERLEQFAWENYKSQEQKRGKEKMENNETMAPHFNEPYQHCQHDTRTGGGIGDYGISGVGRTQDHEASAHKDGVTDSRNKQTTGSKRITEDYSLENSKVTDRISVSPTRDKTRGPRRGNECVPTVKTSIENETTRGANLEKKTTWGANLEKKTAWGANLEKKTAWGANLENKTQTKKPLEGHNSAGTRDAFNHVIRANRKGKPQRGPTFFICGKFRVTFLFCLVLLAILVFHTFAPFQSKMMLQNP